MAMVCGVAIFSMTNSGHKSTGLNVPKRDDLSLTVAVQLWTRHSGNLEA